jgi:hypothetical protein
MTVIENDPRSDLALLRINGYRAADPLNVILDARVAGPWIESMHAQQHHRQRQLPVDPA